MVNSEINSADRIFLPMIQPIFDSQKDQPYNAFYRDVIHDVLREILSDFIPSSTVKSPQGFADLRVQFHALIPFVTSRTCLVLPGEMSFFFVSKYRANSFKFFFEIICNWMVPGKRLNVSMIYAVDFRMPELSDEIYTLCEIKIHVESQEEVEQILVNLPLSETEIRLGIESSHYARHILEIKGLSADEKTAMIQEDIAFLISRLPKEFHFDILTEMQHVLVLCREEFKAARECRHLSRIISLQYLFRKLLREAVLQAPSKRHLRLKLFRTTLTVPQGTKQVLAIVVGVNFIREKEFFDKVHLLKAIQKYIPTSQSVENSFFTNRRGLETVCTLYLEIEQSDGSAFSDDQIKLLRSQLPSDLKERVEYLMHPVFMPRNEEEIFRNILSLSNQIRFVRDIPQVFISFDEQTQTHLFFTVILVRVLKEDDLPIQRMFKESNTFLNYIQDRCQSAGTLRRKHKKEATVFRVKFLKDQFLRVDHSIDLNKARQAVVSELSSVLGEFRDFNGGMISKQNELLSQVKELLSVSAKHNDHLLENFFYSLTPVVTRAVLEAEAVQMSFLMLLESIEQGFFNGENYAIKVVQDSQFVFVMVKTDDLSLKDELSRTFGKLQLHSSELANSFISMYDTIYIGYIYRSEEKEKQDFFYRMLQNGIKQWKGKKNSGSFQSNKRLNAQEMSLKQPNEIELP